MSQKEINRLPIIEKVESKQLSQLNAAKLLGVSSRQVRRLQAKYRHQGPPGLVSKRRGFPSNNRIPAELTEAALALIKVHYHDFGPTLAREKLVEQHDVTLSVESCRQLMIKEGLWKSKRKKVAEVHQMRRRRSLYGELVQIDGSPHAWFEDRAPKCTLLAFIDDATGKIMQLHFEEQESTQGYFDATKKYLQAHGKPLAYYSDRHNIFRVNIKEAKSGTGETQYSRALHELDITLINANSPQAKGRVERLNSTVQDRLVKELRLKGISDIASANAFAPEYIAGHNQRFAVTPASPVDAHRPVKLSEEKLDHILCQKHTRKITKNLEVHYNNHIYQIQTETPAYTMRGAGIAVHDNQGKVTLIYKGYELEHKVFSKQQRPTPIATSKQINQEVDNRKQYKPASTHPWRRGPCTNTL